MRIVATSDIHGVLPTIPKCDVLVLGGDLCPDFFDALSSSRYSKGEATQSAWLDNEFRTWLCQVPAKHVVGIAGNHDFVFEKKGLIPTCS